ncbi:MAG: YiiX/YebB-like N1pC/P60 family cysteine hydrolase [Granulosicoccus sp.]
MLRLISTVESLTQAADALDIDAPSEDFVSTVVERGYFRPSENEAIGYWFARFLTVRDALWDTIREVLKRSQKGISKIETDEDWRLFLVGYAAACILIRLDRLLLFRVADHSVIQRKLNEEFQEYRIPRKQFTRIFSAFIDHNHALLIYDAMHLARTHRQKLEALKLDEHIGSIAKNLDHYESWLDSSRRNYLKRTLSYLSHKWRRRSVVAMNKSLAHLMESAGRTASGVGGRERKKITAQIRAELAQILEPGDVLITRHDRVLTNLFLPGYWPHAALYIGTPDQRDAMDIDIDADKHNRWCADRCVLEALKDGVRFRPLSETLNVDHVVVLRPAISNDAIKQGIERVVCHEGKPYNFDFDFFSSEKLVCTEVIYRAFDGLENLHFPLTQRSGRQTLSAEDILNYAHTSQKLYRVGPQ